MPKKHFTLFIYLFPFFFSFQFGCFCFILRDLTWHIKRRLSIFTVFSRPTILLHPKNISIYLEDKAITVIFTCEASGFPLPVISWLKNNLTATSGTLIQNGSISSLVLRLQNGEEPLMKYRCIAENSLGKTSSNEAALVIRARTHSLGVRTYSCSNISFLLTSCKEYIHYVHTLCMEA